MQDYPRITIKTDMEEIFVHPDQLMAKIPHDLSIRNSGKLKGQAAFLPEILWDNERKSDAEVKWTIARDELNVLCVVPLIIKLKSNKEVECNKENLI